MANKPLYAVGVDAGSMYTRSVICAVDEGRIRFLGAGESDSAGWVKGRIVDQKAAGESILRSVRWAERDAQATVESAALGMGGCSVRGSNIRGVMDFGRPREIDDRDVQRAVRKATGVHLQDDRMVLQLFTQDFLVDDHPGHRDPRSMVASCLEANVHLITASSQEHACLIGAANLAHLAVEETVFEPLAACYASVMTEDRREGIALIDIGAHSTQAVVYYGDALQLTVTLPICGDHFVRDVARGFCISCEDASRIIEDVGCATTRQCAASSMIEVPDREPREAPRRKLAQILEARAEELFQFILRELGRVGMEQALMGGVLLAGGIARLPGMCDIAQVVLKAQTRPAVPVGIEDWPAEIEDPAWTTAAGLAMYSARLKVRADEERRPVGLLSKILR